MRVTLGGTAIQISGGVGTSYTRNSGVYVPLPTPSGDRVTLMVVRYCAQAQANPRTFDINDVSLKIIGFYQAI